MTISKNILLLLFFWLWKKERKKAKSKHKRKFCSQQNLLPKFILFKVRLILFYSTHHHSQSTPASTPSNPKHAHHNFAPTCVCLFLSFAERKSATSFAIRFWNCQNGNLQNFVADRSSTHLRGTSFQLDVTTTTKMLRRSHARTHQVHQRLNIT